MAARSRLIGATFLSAALAAPAFAAEPGPLLGFSSASSQTERAVEAKFDANLSADAIGARLKDMSSQVNNVGSPHDKANAEASAAWLKSWGWDARIEVFDVLYPTPLAETLELTGPAPSPPL